MVRLIINFRPSTQMPYIFIQEVSSCCATALNPLLSVYYPVLDWETLGEIIKAN